MILEEGKTYTRDELIEFMGVSPRVWKDKHNELLDNLANYYEYEINYNDSKQNIKWTYHIIRKLGEYHPIERKTKKLKEFNALLEKNIIKIIDEDNLQSAANIARLITKFDEYDKDKFAAYGFTEGYIYELVRLKMKDMYGEYQFNYGKKGYIKDRVNCVANTEDCVYSPLSEKEYEFLKEAYCERFKEVADDEIELQLSYSSGLITKKQLMEASTENRIQAFIAARRDFKEKFGFYPIKVNEYNNGLPMIWGE